MGEVDDRLLGAIDRTILTPSSVSYVVDKVVERVFAAQRTAPERSRQIDADLRSMRRELDHFVALIAGGNAPDRILEEIEGRERRIKTLEAERERLRVTRPARLDIARVRELALVIGRRFARDALYRRDAGAPSVASSLSRADHI